MRVLHGDFKFKSESGTSERMVNSGNSICGIQIKGKNPLNLQGHFQSYHRQELTLFMEKDVAR